MKILCETQVITRQPSSTTVPVGGNRVRALKATLAVGYHPPAKENSEMQILHFTPQCRSGIRYKVKENIEKIYTKFINDGKATISFKKPQQDLMIKCDPIQLKGFLRTVKLGLEGKATALSLRLNSASMTAIPAKNHPITKLSVRCRSDYPDKGFPKSLKSLAINGINLIKLSFEICSLRNLTTLNMSENTIKNVPSELGRLSLIDVNFASNAIGESNNWRWLAGPAVMKSLSVLDLSDNSLTYFPMEIIKLPKLVTLKLNNNAIKRVPFAIRRLLNLRFLHMSTNKLESLPSSLNHLRLDVLDVWGNQFQPKGELKLNENQLNVESALPLVILAARAVSKYKLPYSPATIPLTLVDVISETPICLCGRLSFSANLIERAMVATLTNVTHLTFSRNRLIYSDVVVCSMKCANRNRNLIQGQGPMEF